MLFMGFAAHTWFFHDEDEVQTEKDTPVLADGVPFWPAVCKSFVVIFIAEWGDMTQLATASLAARFHEYPVTVLVSATLALWGVTLLAVMAGKKVGQAVHIRVLSRWSAALMLGVGVYFVATVW
jgi:putative Ca2+/H+ antiporter (TMEM165/GDT1 family)